MQQYPCYICKRDSTGGGSLVFEGMFFKLCVECLEDEDVTRKLNEYMMQIESGEDEE